MTFMTLTKIRREGYDNERKGFLLKFCLSICLSWNFVLMQCCVLSWVTKFLMRAI